MVCLYFLSVANACDVSDRRIPFAYPLFLEVWQYIQNKRRKLDGAKEMRWEEIENGLAGVSDQLNKINPSKWKKVLEKSLQSPEIRVQQRYNPQGRRRRV